MEHLNWSEKLQIDESVEKIDYHEYEPHTGTNLNGVGDIRIVIQNQDDFLLPSKSYIYAEGSLRKNDGARIANDDNELNKAITNNGIMYMFSRVAYRISNQEVEGYSNPGRATTMKGLLTYPHDYPEGMSFLWAPDTDKTIENNEGFKQRSQYLIKTDLNKGNFSVAIPLSHIFGFCENYNKVIYGVKHELVLRRTEKEDDAIFKTDQVGGAGNVPIVGDLKINFSKLSWRIPHIKIADESKLKLYKQIENKATLALSFLNRQCEKMSVPDGVKQFDWRLNVTAGAEKPRYIILGFQTKKEEDQETNASLFDHTHVLNAYVLLNSERYPEADQNLSFRNNQYTTAYQMLTSYFNDVLNKETCPITLYDYKHLYPLYVFDVSRQSERLKNSVTDIRIKVSFGMNTPKDTIAYALILSDRVIKLQSDGNKMNVIY